MDSLEETDCRMGELWQDTSERSECWGWGGTCGPAWQCSDSQFQVNIYHWSLHIKTVAVTNSYSYSTVITLITLLQRLYSFKSQHTVCLGWSEYLYQCIWFDISLSLSSLFTDDNQRHKDIFKAWPCNIFKFSLDTHWCWNIIETERKWFY